MNNDNTITSWNKSANTYVPSRYIWEIEDMKRETV